MNANAIVGQSGGPTAVINSSLAGVYDTAKKLGCGKIFGMRYGIEGLLEEQMVDLSLHIRHELDIELLKRTPASFLGTCRYKLPEVTEDENTYKKLFNILEKYNIKFFFYIGGNDSMDTIKKLSNYAKSIGSTISFVGVPKTIDNDLAMTDHTPGYGSAAKYIASAVKEIISDANTYKMPSVTIVEIMGRNAGWLTGASALSKASDCPGPDLIYLPETIFDYDKFIDKIEALKSENRAITIAVSEGVKTADGKYVCEANKQSKQQDMFGHQMLGGTALYISDFVAQNIGMKSRGIVFSTLQRCASHIVSRRDITEAFAVGATAVQLAFEGMSGIMITLDRISNSPYQVNTGYGDVNKIANIEKKVPLEWITNDNTYVSEEFVDYVRPLIIGELSPFMVDGLPRHLHIND